VGEIARTEISEISADADLGEAVRLLMRQQRDRLLVVIGNDHSPVGIITDSDVLQALEPGGGHGNGGPGEMSS
jgi:predicted transcriptional regulator